MSFLLDTNICSDYLKRPGPLTHRFVQHGGRLHLSTLVLHELLTWVYRRPDPTFLLGRVQSEFIEKMQVHDFDLECSERSGRLQATLLDSGVVIPSLDLMIAATALVHDLTVVTRNTRPFAVVPGLRVVDWTGK